MSKHTPGPWEAWNTFGGKIMKQWRIGERNSTPGIVRPVAVICNEDEQRSGDEQTANAALIAASPDLLEALRDLCAPPEGSQKALGLHNGLGQSGGAMQKAYDAARAAIAKAEP
jgi:hypothetical protein